MMQASLGVLLSSQPSGRVGDSQLLAAEAVFELLGCARDFLQSEDSLCRELLEALVFACRAAMARCRRRERELAEQLEDRLAAATLRCLGRVATESAEVLSHHISLVAPVVLEALQGTLPSVSMVAVEFWSSLALQDVAGISGGSYAGDSVVAEFIPQLTPQLLKMLDTSSNASISGELGDHGADEAVGTCLQLLVKIEEDDVCLQHVCQFLEQSPLVRGAAPSPRPGDLLALEAVMESPSPKSAEAVQRFCALVSAAMGQQHLRAQAAKTAVRALQTHGECIAETIKEDWLQKSLMAIRDAAGSFEYGQLLQQLMLSACVTPQHFETLARQLLATFQEAPQNSAARPSLLRALGALIEASPEGGPYLGLLLSQFIGALKQCHSIDGAGSCLKALTLRLGPAVAEFADHILGFCASNFAAAVWIRLVVHHLPMA